MPPLLAGDPALAASRVPTHAPLAASRRIRAAVGAEEGSTAHGSGSRVLSACYRRLARGCIRVAASTARPSLCCSPPVYIYLRFAPSLFAPLSFAPSSACPSESGRLSESGLWHPPASSECSPVVHGWCYRVGHRQTPWVRRISRSIIIIITAWLRCVMGEYLTQTYLSSESSSRAGSHPVLPSLHDGSTRDVGALCCCLSSIL